MTDITAWTNNEIAAEMAAWATNGEGARLEAERAFEVWAEYDRRTGAVPPSEADRKAVFLRAMEAAQS